MIQALNLLRQTFSTVYGLFDEKQWAALSAVGTVLQALIALLGLLYVGAQLKAGRKAADLQSLQEMYRTITEREQALLQTRDTPAAHDAAFLEFVNYLELQTLALHGKLMGKHSREIMREKIIDSLATFETLPEWQSRFMAARSSSTTFKHLFRFIRRNRKAITAVKSDMLKQAGDTQESLEQGSEGTDA